MIDLNKKERVEYLYNKYKQYKETAEQHEFPKLVVLDSLLIPAYNDLQKNWNEEHADSFIRGMENSVCPKLGIIL
jgi:hypothetical protein